MRDSSRIEPIPPNIRNDIVSESGMTRTKARLEKKKIMKPYESPPPPPDSKKKSIRGDLGDSLPVWNRGIRQISVILIIHRTCVHNEIEVCA